MAVYKLTKKEFLGRVTMVCQKAAWLFMDGETLDLEQVRRGFEIKMNTNEGEGSGKGGSAEQRLD
ncbi:hypothetical protein M413DRAFT_450169, partial [Hebeloma cylindrosporum]